MHYFWAGSSELLKLILDSIVKFLSVVCFGIASYVSSPGFNLYGFPLFIPLFFLFGVNPKRLRTNFVPFFTADAFSSNLFLLMPFINAAGPQHYGSITITMLDCVIVIQQFSGTPLHHARSK